MNMRIGLMSNKSKDAKDFFNIVARLYDARPDTIRRWWKSVYEAIVRELYVNGVVYLPDIGYITLQLRPEQIQKQHHPDGTVRYYSVPERDIPIFHAEDDFINDINMIGVTKSYRKRVKKGITTLRDKERERRAAEIMGIKEEVTDTKDKEHQEMLDDFSARMKQMRDDYENKLKEQLDGQNEE